MLSLENVSIGYDKKQVLFGLSLKSDKNQITAIIGPNGSGKSTALKTILGLISLWDGKIIFDKMLINGNSPAKNVKNGIILAPQGNRVFDELKVSENLEMGGYYLKKIELKPRIEKVLELFPELKELLKRKSSHLSGGEQQMVSIARSLISEPKLLMLDEPSLGLSPKLVLKVFDKIVEINKTTGTTILIVEQKVRQVLEICDYVYSLKLGKVAYSGKPDQLKNNSEKLKELFL